jgi:Predicted membrane protein (DUF2207) C-terminal domain/Predicted membrane protein (DUF2207) N-terminal domain
VPFVKSVNVEVALGEHTKMATLINRRSVSWKARIGWWVVVAGVALAGPAAAASKEYSADRFDVSIKVQPGGDLRVDETAVFDFTNGSFTRVWRDIPASRTDGIEVLQATMDGVVLPMGDRPGQVSVSGRNRVRIEWHFAALEASTHTFGLSYVARGVGVITSAGDEVAWNPLPIQHAYRIAASRIEIESPVAPQDTRVVQSHRLDYPPPVIAGDGMVSAEMTNIPANGWFTLSVRFAPRSVVTADPGWRQRQDYQWENAPRWALTAGIAFVFVTVLAIGMRRSYPPPSEVPPPSTTPTPPAPLAPATAAAIAARGRMPPTGAIATLMDLAERGVIAIRELPRHFGVRQYELSTIAGRHDLAPHEEVVVRIVFADRADAVTLSKARGRLVRGSRQFASEVDRELRVTGMLDEMRANGSSRLKGLGVTLLLTGFVLVIPAVAMINQQGPWPLLVPLALVIGGLVTIIAGATMTVLSDQGVMAAAQWLGYRQHLRDMARGRDDAQPSTLPARTLVYAVALGLAPQWSRYLKRHASALPPWFGSISENPGDGAAAFASFVHSGGASGAGGAGAGAAGGGGSGAG